MRIRIWFLAAVWLGLALSVACGSMPVPRKVLKGTSFTVLLSGERWAGETGIPLLEPFDIGYGGEWAFGSTPPFRDLQRGEIQFYLWDPANPDKVLKTDLTTRVFPDPASAIARLNGTPVPFLQTTIDVGLAQVQALVFVPCTTVTGTYPLNARKVYRDASGGLGIGQPHFSWWLPYELTIEVAADACPGGDTDESGRSMPNLSLAGQPDPPITSDPDKLHVLYPDPKLLVWFPTDIPEPPAAAHIEIVVSADVQILDVFEEQHYGRGSLVTWSMDPVEPDRVLIDFVSFESSPTVTHLSIVFGPGPSYSHIFNTDPGFETLVNAAYTVDAAATRFWDTSGYPVTGSGAIDHLGPIR